MQKRIVEDYVKLFENAKNRNRSIDNLQKLVTARIKKLDLHKLQLKRILDDIAKFKSSEDLELNQLQKLSLKLHEFNALASELSPMENELLNRQFDKRLKNEADSLVEKKVDYSKQNRILESEFEASEYRSTQPNINSTSALSKRLDQYKSPPQFPDQQQHSHNRPLYITTVPLVDTTKLESFDSQNEAYESPIISSQIIELKSSNSDEDHTLIYDSDDKPDSFREDLAKYYPKLIVEEPSNLRVKHDYKLPNLNLKIVRNDYLKVVTLQNLYLQLGVPFELWGIYICQNLSEELIASYLQLSAPPSWYDVMYLLFANQDMFINNALKINSWTQFRPHSSQSIHEFLYQFKQRVESTRSENPFEIEKSIIISLLNPGLISPEFKLQLKAQSDREKFYHIILTQFPDTMTFQTLQTEI